MYNAVYTECREWFQAQAPIQSAPESWLTQIYEITFWWLSMAQLPTSESPDRKNLAQSLSEFGPKSAKPWLGRCPSTRGKTSTDLALASAHIWSFRQALSPCSLLTGSAVKSGTPTPQFTQPALGRPVKRLFLQDLESRFRKVKEPGVFYLWQKVLHSFKVPLLLEKSEKKYFQGL